MRILNILELTWNDDVTEVPLVGDVVDAEPANVEDGQLARKRELDVLVDVLAKRLEVAKFVSNLQGFKVNETVGIV